MFRFILQQLLGKDINNAGLIPSTMPLEKKEITPEYRCPHCSQTFRESPRFLNHVTKHHCVPALYTPSSPLIIEDPDINDLEFCEVCIPYISHTP